jgi:hypothetical protein
VGSRRLPSAEKSRGGLLNTVDLGRAIGQAVRAGFPSQRPGFESRSGQVMWDFWWTRGQWSRFSMSASVSPTNSHSTDCSTLIIYHPGLVQ